VNPPESSLRKVLADSHVAAIAIAMLLVSAVDHTFRALWSPISELIKSEIGYVSPLAFPYAKPILILTTSSYISAAVTALSIAWILSHWVFGTGPIQILTRYRDTIARRNDA